MRWHLPAETYDSEPPPLLRTWTQVYLLVLGWLAVVVGVCYAFTRYFA